MTRTQQGPDVTGTIQLARVVCIFFMMYAHVSGYESAIAAGTNWASSPVGFLAEFLHRVMSKASVPLLSFISGWLFARSFKGGVISTARRKFRSLIVPLVFWNLLLSAVFLVAGNFVVLQWTRPERFAGWANDLLGIARWPVDYPLYFLRDLFVSTLAGAALLSVTRDRRLIWLAAIGVFALVAAVPVVPVLLTPLILVQFMLGIACQRSWDITTVPATRAIAVFGLALLIAHQLLAFRNDLIDQAVFRLAAAAIGWAAVSLLARLVVMQPVVRISHTIFIVFCVHYPVFIFINGILKRVTGTTSGPVWTIYFFVGPFVALLIGVTVYGVLRRWLPRVLAMLTGNREGGKKVTAPEVPLVTGAA